MSEEAHPGPQVFCVGVAQMGGSRRHVFTIKHHQTGQQNHQLVVITNLIEKEREDRNFTLIRSRPKESKVLQALEHLQSWLPHSNVEVVPHLELLQVLQRLQTGDVLQLVVTEVQEPKGGKVEVLRQLLQLVPGQIPTFQRLQTRQEADWKVLELQV